MSWARGSYWPGLGAGVLALASCDPTSGLADSADAALPDTKRYFDGRGSLLAEGPWHRVVVDLDVETLYHVGARRLDDETPTFHLFGSDARQGCEVTPNAGTWLMGKPDRVPFRLLPFLESIDDRGRGRLRFTQLDCTVQDVVVEDAGRPYPRLYDHGYLVPTKRGYTFVDPWLGQSREIAADLRRALVWNDGVLLWADGELKSFSEQFEAGSHWGNQPVAIVRIKDDFLVEDADGLHHVTFDRDSLEITAKGILGDACHLQDSGLASVDGEGAWVALQQPCGSAQPTLVQLDPVSFEALASYQLPFEADSRSARALVAAAHDDVPAIVGAAYVTDVDDDGRGTVFAWRSGLDAPVQLGEHADLDSVQLQPETEAWQGVAQTNYQSLGGYLAHDWLKFRWDGATEVIAERIVHNGSSGDTLVNFDGVGGELVQFTADGYRVLASGVPAYSGELTSFVGDRHHARIDRFEGESGRLVLGTDSDDPGSWQELGLAVPPELLRFSWFMPAIVFIEGWDPERRTGALVAYNYELDARATIAEGVSSFDLTSYPWDGVVYSVPRGKQRGIWFSKAK